MARHNESRSAAPALTRGGGLRALALGGIVLLALGSCMPKVAQEDAQEPITISGITAPATVYLTQNVPVTVVVGGTPGKSASWTFLVPPGGGSFSPATGSVTLDANGSAAINSTYTAPLTTPGTYTNTLTLLRDSGFSATAEIPITVLVPTVSIASFSAPSYLRNSATAPLSIFVQGSPGVTATWTLTANRGTFAPASGTVVLNGGATPIISSYTLPAGTGAGTSSSLTLQATLVGTGIATPQTTVTTTTAAGIALFANTGNDVLTAPTCGFLGGGYVDYCPGSTGSEASNLEATLTSQGFAVTPFTGITATDFAAASQTKAVLALPEMEQGSLGTTLLADATAAGTIVQWVQSGGVLLVSHPNDSPDDLIWLNSAFALALAPSASGVTTGNLVPVTGAFAAGPASIPYNNDTMAVASNTLPGGAQIIYQEATSLDAIVTVIPYGSGRIVILGWDWFDSNPPDTTLGQDAGWISVLQKAVTAAQAGTL